MPYVPSLTALRCLDASARLRSFTRAGEELHLTQSAVSHHILILERELGVKLFIREPGGLRLTPAGKMYWEDTFNALQLLQRAAQRVGSRRRQNTLTITVPPSFANHWLMPRVGAFASSNPDVTLNLVNHHDSKARGGEPDATIELSEGDSAGYVSLRLLSLVYRPYASPSLLSHLKVARRLVHRGDLELGVLTRVLRSASLIRTSMDDAWEGWLRLSKLDQSIDPGKLKDGPVYAQASLALGAVTNGTGVALLPKHVVDTHLHSGAVVRLSGLGWQPSKAYHLQWPARSPVSEPLRRFADWAASIAESEAD